MNVALQTQRLNWEREVLSQTLRKEESQDAVVPDTLPDIGEILGVSGDVLIRSKDVGQGHVRLEANVPARVCYLPEEGEGVRTLELSIPLYLNLEEECIPEGAVCVADLKLTALEAKLLNPRKISVRAEVEFGVRCFAPEQAEFSGPPETQPEGVNLREGKTVLTPVCAVTEKTFVLSDEFTIPASQPAASELLRQSTAVQTEDVKAVSNKLMVKGSVRSALLYAGEDGATGAVEFSTPFSQIIDVPELPEDCFPEVNVLLSGVYYDLGGDGRTGSMELHLVAQAVVCGKTETVYVSDAYSNRCALECETSSREYSAMQRTVVLRETLREQLPTATAAAEILQGSWALGTPEAAGTSGLSLPVTITACYRSSESMLRMTKRCYTVKFDCQLADNESLHAVSAVAQELYLAPSAEGIEVRLPLELTAQIWETFTLERIEAIDYDESSPLDHSDRPSLVILRAGSGDDLWKLARENSSTVRAITEANGLELLTEPWEKLLLIPKAE